VARVTRSTRIEAPVARVWALIADIERWPRWIDAPYASESVAWEPAGPPAVGSAFVLRGRLPYRLSARVTEWDEQRSFRFEVTASEYPSDRLFLARAEAGFRLESLDAQHTRVTYEHIAEGRGLIGRAYMATLFRLFLMRNASRVIAGLRRAAVT
jgi:hypothetical protein